MPSSTTTCSTQGSEFVHDFNDASTSAVEPLGLAKADPTSLRVCAYNVLGNGLIHPNRQAHFERILPAVDADVTCSTSVEGQAPTRAKSLLTRGFHWTATKVGTPRRMAI